MTELVREAEAGKVIVARLKHGQEMIGQIEKICIKHNIHSAYIPTIIGGLEEADLVSMQQSEPKLKNKQIKHRGPFEVQGSGTISLKDNKPFPHIHINLARFGNEALSGHLVSAKIALFIEIMIVELKGINMVRVSDPEVYRLPLLNFK
ncbi:MAG: DUF296 domain-containing protein [Nanoarchaeota archaeon]